MEKISVPITIEYVLIMNEIATIYNRDSKSNLMIYYESNIIFIYVTSEVGTDLMQKKIFLRKLGI